MNDGGRLKQPCYRGDIPDELVEAFIHEHPEGASAEAIAQTIGLSRERVSVILKKALEKLRRVAERRDISPHDIPSRESIWDRIASG